MKKFKKLTDKQVAAIEAEVKMMLHAHRDCLRNKYHNDPNCYNPKVTSFSVSDGYYGEAFGIMRTLQVLGYGKFGAVNSPPFKANLSWWFSELQQEVLKEENWHNYGNGSGECDYCLDHYGKDDAGRKRGG